LKGAIFELQPGIRRLFQGRRAFLRNISLDKQCFRGIETGD